MTTTTRRYWKNRLTGLPLISKGIRQLNPEVWIEITKDEYLLLRATTDYTKIF